MADWKDWLEGISGGFRGVTEGLTLGMKPFDAWEKVRTQDLANDKSEVQLEDLYGVQGARNAMPNYYGDLVAAANSGNRKTLAQNDSDIFGVDRQLQLQQYLSDPNGAFQQGLRETGWQPGDPEYRQWLAEAMAMYNPEAAVKANDAYGIPAMQNRNVNEQAALAMVEGWVKQQDPGAQVLRLPSGEVVVLGSDGEITQVPGSLLVKAADMLTNKGGPAGAITEGIGTEMKIAKTNADVYTALTKGQITPQQALTQVTANMNSAMKELATLSSQRNAVVRSPAFLQADDAGKAAMLAAIDGRMTELQGVVDQSRTVYTRILSSSTPRGITSALPTNLQQSGGYAPQGGTTVTTRPNPAQIASRAAGAAGMPMPQMGPPSNLAPVPASRGRPSGPRSASGLIGGQSYNNTYGEQDALQAYIDNLLNSGAQ